MNTFTVAEIPFLNSAPFFWDKTLHIPGSAVAWKTADPKTLGRMAMEGEIDAGLFSLMDTEKLSRFEFLPFGITAKNAAQSVILFSRVPFRELHEEQVGLTPQSATSAELLKLLLKELHRTAPIYQLGFSADDTARLLIGNQALIALEDPGTQKNFPYQMDLGEAWKNWKGHSFVFARWMVRKDAPDMAKARLEEWIAENLRKWEANASRALEAYETAQGWKMSGAEKYISGFEYRLQESDYFGSLTTLSQFSNQRATSIS